MDDKPLPQLHKPAPDPQVKRTIWIMWIGIAAIIAIGLLVAVYFIFVQPAEAPTKNSTNEAAAANQEAEAGELADIPQIFADPDAYHDQEVCLTGYYQQTEDFSGMAASAIVDTDGNEVLEHDADLSNVVWIDAPVQDYTCGGCVLITEICGIFQARQGKAGFGPDGAYQYRLTASASSSDQADRDWGPVSYSSPYHTFAFSAPADWEVIQYIDHNNERQPLVTVRDTSEKSSYAILVSYYDNPDATLPDWVRAHEQELVQSHEQIITSESDYTHPELQIVMAEMKDIFKHAHCYRKGDGKAYELYLSTEIEDWPAYEDVFNQACRTFSVL